MCAAVERAGAALGLIQELKLQFPMHDVLDAHGVVYVQYWLSSDVDSNFTKHLHVLK